MISPVGVIGVSIWSICRWLMLTQDMGMLLISAQKVQF